MQLQINLNIKSTLSKSPFADTEKLSKEIAKVIDRTEKELNERNIPHCSEYIVNVEGCIAGVWPSDSCNLTMPRWSNERSNNSD